LIAALTGMCRVVGSFAFLENFDVYRNCEVVYKGYGFIQPQGGGQDVFVHISAVEKAGLSTLNEGQNVEFEVVNNRGKSSAENLKVK
jgi:cold shock protein